jgi:hypothetical protein
MPGTFHELCEIVAPVFIITDKAIAKEEGR